MFRLTREIRFAIDARAATPERVAAAAGVNGHGGVPPVEHLSSFFVLRISLEGPLDPASGYLRNIKDIDELARDELIPRIVDHLRDPWPQDESELVIKMRAHASHLARSWTPPASITALQLCVSPYHSLEARKSELGMIRLSQKFEFSAAHRLHNPEFDDDTNRALFGKCNNPRGHGHNYELQVTLLGRPDPNTGRLMATADLERVVDDIVLKRFDHKHLNEETEEFRTVIPSVEQIARVIFGLLKPELSGKLASVTVWETPKTWCEYSE